MAAVLQIQIAATADACGLPHLALGHAPAQPHSGRSRAAWVFVHAPDTKITKAKISSKHHRASFRFKAIGTATGFQCALIKQVKHHEKPSPRFRSCRSPKLYSSLKSGRYQFLVRALNSAPVGTPAKKTFTIR